MRFRVWADSLVVVVVGLGLEVGVGLARVGVEGGLA